ncbi:hypothetical protein V8G54_006832, partial [Vigna mungo]
ASSNESPVKHAEYSEGILNCSRSLSSSSIRDLLFTFCISNLLLRVSIDSISSLMCRSFTLNMANHSFMSSRLFVADSSPCNTSSIKGSLSKMACTFAASRAWSSLFNLSENASASPTPMI